MKKVSLPLICALLSSLLLTPPARAFELDEASGSMDEVGIPSGGVKLNGLIYLAAGRQPHPVVVFLHGYPGNERNLDTAQDVRRAGYDALYFDYRGSWGTGGTFSFRHGLEDVDAVIAWLQTPAVAAKYHIDPKRIILVGHSFGGWLALMSAAHLPDSVCISAMAAWNVGWAAQRFDDYPKEREETLAYFHETTDGDSGPIDAKPDDLIAEMVEHAAPWDYLQQAAALKSHALLLVGATDDSPDEDAVMSRTLAKAVKQAGGHRVHSLTYEDDHPFSGHRDALSAALLKWLKTDCAAQQKPLPASKR
ncbi:alpha/beta hydrolase family protein [Hydrocarboniphaga sp.]|uniref:alpha/beta hydrolase family protein n=1 Tax=Hydrocarboniphaga sp. TaxID=2033016 RepID=UPI003D0AA112